MPETIQHAWSRVGRLLRLEGLRDLIVPFLMLLVLGGILIALLTWQLPFGNSLLIEPGEIAPFTVVSPKEITYESEVRTDQARAVAEQQVVDQYDSQEAAIRREQVVLAREAMAQVSEIRRHVDDTLARQTDDLMAIDALNIDAETVVQILSLSDEQWAQTEREVPIALDRVMRMEIRDATLNQARRNVPGVISGSLDDLSSDVAILLVRNLLRPNSFYNAERTEAMRAEARAAVPMQSVTLTEGETIIRSGDKATLEQAEALGILDGLQSQWDLGTFARGAVFGLLLLIVTTAALLRVRRSLLWNPREQALIGATSLLWLIAAKLMMVNDSWAPFLFPLAAFGILLTVLCDLRVAQVLITMFSVTLLFMLPNNATVVIYQTMGAMAATLVVGRAERPSLFLWAGLAVIVVNFVVMVAMDAPFSTYSSAMLMELLIVVAVSGGLSAAVALIGYFVLGNLFGVTTPLQLTELSRPTHPLLRQLLLKASGTYHHTILVSNLAERAAAAIGADALLVRVGAYYHDIGKTVRPYFFAENILDDSSPHERLDPLTSAQIIISHVKDGLDLAQKYKLPERIQDFIREHHGRSLVKYFYLQAQRQAGEGEPVAEEDFRYPGPNPRSRETAILMLADTCEAAVRAMRPSSREELELVVSRLIDERISSGELNESDLTFKELQVVKDVFLHVLQGVHHPRIKYPPNSGAADVEESAAAAAENGATPHIQSRQNLGGIEEPAVLQPTERMAAIDG